MNGSIRFLFVTAIVVCCAIFGKTFGIRTCRSLALKNSLDCPAKGFPHSKRHRGRCRGPVTQMENMARKGSFKGTLQTLNAFSDRLGRLLADRELRSRLVRRCQEEQKKWSTKCNGSRRHECHEDKPLSPRCSQACVCRLWR